MDALKFIHIASAFISIAGFVLRGYWKLTGSRYLAFKPVRIVPHIVDTVLLVSAIMLALRIEQYPFTHGWLTAKLLALILYIFLGVVVMRIAKTYQSRLLAYILAIVVFIYIMLVAMTHHVVPLI